MTNTTTVPQSVNRLADAALHHARRTLVETADRDAERAAAAGMVNRILWRKYDAVDGPLDVEGFCNESREVVSLLASATREDLFSKEWTAQFRARVGATD